jgi:DNA transformation protein
MFGGFGLYCDGRFFGLIARDTLYLKVDEASRDEYVHRGCRPFRPYADRPHLSMSYYEVPADVLEDADAMVAWARKALVAASAAAARKPPTPRRRRRDA